MNYARVGVYTLSGTPTEVTRLATEEMLPIFKRQPGFVNYQVVTAPGKLISISTWQSEAQANEGTKQAATFVNSHPGMLTLDHNFVGDITMFSRA
jgi:heme-degrading monooxygenase HmoA